MYEEPINLSNASREAATASLATTVGASAVRISGMTPADRLGHSFKRLSSGAVALANLLPLTGRTLASLAVNLVQIVQAWAARPGSAISWLSR